MILVKPLLSIVPLSTKLLLFPNLQLFMNENSKVINVRHRSILYTQLLSARNSVPEVSVAADDYFL